MDSRIRRTTSVIIAILCLLLLAGSMVAIVYGYYERKAERLEESGTLNSSAANAYKHALAAADAYRLLATISHKRAAHWVWMAGIGNEYLELLAKRTPDNAAELRKDMMNNLIGIDVAKHYEISLGHCLIALAKQDILITHHQHPLLQFGNQNNARSQIASAQQWAMRQHEALKDSIAASIAASCMP